MDIEIRKLIPDLAEDYVHFFDTTPHDDNVDEHKCYCVCWCNDDYEGKDFSTAEKRRQCALQYVNKDSIPLSEDYKISKVMRLLDIL